MANYDLKEYEVNMDKRIDLLKENLAGIRAGRANPAILDKLYVDYYGVSTPVNQVASIQVPEARSIVIQPWDATLLKEIEKAVQKSDIGINPMNDGKCLRLSFPPLTEERRKELSKTVKKYGEEAKISIRNIRREALEFYKKEEKSSSITEDDLKRVEKDIQDLTDKKCEDVDKVVENKEKEILEV